MVLLLELTHYYQEFMSNKIFNIAILFGGQSGEHDVSVASAQSVIAALNKNKNKNYKVIPIAIDKSGKWLPPLESSKLLENKKSLTKPPVISKKLIISPGFNSKQKIDLIFPLLHGPLGEDGTVQGMLELVGVPYVGSGVLASALGMDKEMSKKIFKAENILTPSYIVLDQKNWLENISKIKTPCVVKPVNLGSSIGISIVRERVNLKKAIKLALKHDREKRVIIDQFIKGLEITVPILRTRNPKALPVVEIVPKNKNDFFSYDVKYSDNLVDEIVPARISKALTQKAQALGIRAHKALGCKDISRVDMIIQKPGNKIFVLEVNTIPGMTKNSLFPKAAKAAGMSFEKLMERLIGLALGKLR